jgi:hypothetical protein
MSSLPAVFMPRMDVLPVDELVELDHESSLSDHYADLVAKEKASIVLISVNIKSAHLSFGIIFRWVRMGSAYCVRKHLQVGTTAKPPSSNFGVINLDALKLWPTPWTRLSAMLSFSQRFTATGDRYIKGEL